MGASCASPGDSETRSRPAVHRGGPVPPRTARSGSRPVPAPGGRPRRRPACPGSPRRRPGGRLRSRSAAPGSPARPQAGLPADARAGGQHRGTDGLLQHAHTRPGLHQAGRGLRQPPQLGGDDLLEPGRAPLPVSGPGGKVPGFGHVAGFLVGSGHASLACLPLGSCRVTGGRAAGSRGAERLAQQCRVVKGRPLMSRMCWLAAC
jgi:hypothetical protein